MSFYRSPIRFALFLGLGVLAVHWLNQLTGTYALMYDEAQYWFWGKHPALGYYSKPPVIAWLMAASTTLFGDSTFGVRMLAPLLHIGAGFLLARSARLLGEDDDTQAWVFVTYLTLPLVTGLSNFFSTDVPLLFFWSLALYASLRAMLHPPGARWWLLAGIAAGFGLLAKYTMVGFAASVFAALLVAPARRRLLATPWPWLAATVALALFAPNLWWNAQHHFVTFRHTDDNVLSKTIELYPLDTLVFLLAQFALFGPLLMVALLRSCTGMDEKTRLLHSFFWPLAVAGVVVCLIAGAQAHWIGPAYAAGTLIAVRWLKHTGRAAWLRWSLLLHLACLVFFYAAPTLLSHLPAKTNPLARIQVWSNLAQPIAHDLAAVEQRFRPAQPPIVLTDERKIAAALTYGLRDLRGSDHPVYKIVPPGWVRDHYDLVTQQANLAGKPALLVLRNDPPAGMKLQPVETLTFGKYRFTVAYTSSYRPPQ